MEDIKKEYIYKSKDVKQRAMENYRKLVYFFENKISVHIKIIENNEEVWLNGNILDLSEEKLTMVLQELQRGGLPILLEDVTKISKYKEKGEENG